MCVTKNYGDYKAIIRGLRSRLRGLFEGKHNLKTRIGTGLITRRTNPAYKKENGWL